MCKFIFAVCCFWRYSRRVHRHHRIGWFDFHGIWKNEVFYQGGQMQLYFGFAENERNQGYMSLITANLKKNKKGNILIRQDKISPRPVIRTIKPLYRNGLKTLLETYK